MRARPGRPQPAASAAVGCGRNTNLSALKVHTHRRMAVLAELLGSNGGACHTTRLFKYLQL